MKEAVMIDRKELDTQTMEMLETMADDLGVTVEDLLQTIDEAKQEYKEQLS